jgi:two-component system sporulation sensor kinase A
MNPATVIGGLTRRTLEKEKLSKESIEKLKDILTQSQILEKIVSDFEFLVKSKKFIFRREDINEIISFTTSSVEQELKSKGIELSLQLSDKPLYFNANKQLLKIAFGLLLKNSIEATPKGGKIFLYTGKVNEDIFFTIRDTGHGIPTEYMDKIFDPFFSTKERMGMGLPLTKQIVEDHLGVITAESTPGEGSTFRISFPIVWKECGQKSNFEKGIDRE